MYKETSTSPDFPRKSANDVRTLTPDPFVRPFIRTILMYLTCLFRIQKQTITPDEVPIDRNSHVIS